MSSANEVDVQVAGGGPVGLMLTSELARAGTRPLMLERREDIDPTIKAGSINVATVEALYGAGSGRPSGPSRSASRPCCAPALVDVHHLIEGRYPG